MKKIVAFFKNRIVISVFGLIVLSLLIWFVGPAIKFGENNFAPLGGETTRLLAIIIIAVIWGLNNLRIQIQENKNNNELVSDLQQGVDDKGASGSDILQDQTSEEMNQIGERFSHALATLKKLKFKGRGAKAALYELPWYIIIGPPGSGKTTALVNSSLDFPLAEQFGKGALQGVGGTRNCDWWFTNEAVLIDTAGRYTTQDSHKVIDSSAWEGFLGLLKKHRRRRPINGAIITISLQDLLTQTEEERIKHAKTIRTRIDELMDKLEIRFPVYLMFTKCDLVSGFTEFFEDLNKEDREQVWGVSLPNAPKDSEAPDFSYLSTEYHYLVKRLYDRVLWRVHQERDVKRRSAIQGFPQQMENLKGILDHFVQQTFVKNRYRFQPYLRGIYFSSGTQDGTPIDRLMTSVSSNFGFNRDTVASYQQQGKGYFLGQLFRQVIFPESELVGSNRRHDNFIKWSQRAAYVGMASIAVIMLIVWAGSFARHEVYMHEVESYVAEFNAEKKRIKAWTSDIRNTLPTLNALAKASVVYDQEQHPWLSGLGMYDSNVDDAANKAYEFQLTQLFLPKLIKYIEIYLKRGHSGGDLYSTFRTYVMFNKLEHMDKQLVIDWFTAKWEKQLEGQATKRKELAAHLTALLDKPLASSELDKNLLSSTRNLLLRVPVSQRIYERIRTNPKYSQEVDLFYELGESVREFYVDSPAVTKQLSVPLLFTKEGYEDIDFSPDSSVISSIVNERWLLEDDEKAKVDFIQDDLDEISEKVKDHYLADYSAYWQKVYEVLEVKPFKDLRQSSEVLSSFTDPVYSPLLSILHVAASNTQLSNQTVANLASDHGKNRTAKLADSELVSANWTTVDRQFRDLNELIRESSKKPAAVNGIIAKIAQLQEFVNQITLAPDPAKKAFDIAKIRYQSGSGNAVSSLRAYAQNMPKPIRRWLIKISDETWRVILRSAHQHINMEWRTRVYEPYRQALSGRYPISSSSQSEVALHDFIEFFKPGGTMDAFHLEYIKPFINTRDGWQNRSIDNYSLGLSSDTITQIRRALQIKNIFFRNNAEVPSLTFMLKPHFMPKNDARFMLEVGDARLSYSHGPKFWNNLKWAGNDEQNRVRIVFEDLNEQQHSKTFEGPWAWFRLMSQSKLTKTSQSNVYLVTYDVNGRASSRSSKHEITYQIKAKSVNNPFKNNLLGTFRCPERI
ncbi:type VI secretion system membrane subunit TssM [Aliikangiella coralliicola]|uniref:Type VI secretion system membrane subunit TssM n=1 Tax=Aliikangiella coralliicola TaxID=2592383 RepID=A0A545U8S7_9GAMM|nr:type VI secretion system membrane subunit TssM [Aliikangiella coralliicola]TQV85872.1 type VI secretion system membrane subunit TssM [Aliikangiella coralliicola]